VSAAKICPQCGTEFPATERFCAQDGTALRSKESATDLIGAIIADRYLILSHLGEGGMGRVYLAEHVKMGRKSALKLLHPSLTKDISAISRFNREAANASRISHPNVAAIYDFGETNDGLVYLAMEYIEGLSLTSLVSQLKGGTMQMARAAEIIRQTAEALGAAHDMGIVHRDLKPDNIMVAQGRDGTDFVKVVDFGIAKAAGPGADAQKVTRTGHVIGTPDYMSPEQLAGDTLDGRSDIYALGLVAFNLLTGTLPFPADSQQESMIMRLTEKPVTLAEARPEVAWPADLQTVMDKVLERDVDARYRTATEFGREFARAVGRMPSKVTGRFATPTIGSVPVAAAQVPPTRVAAAAKGRNPMVVGVAAAVVLVAAVVIIAGGVMAMNMFGGNRVSATSDTTQPTGAQLSGTPASSTVPADSTPKAPDSTVSDRLMAMIDLSNDPTQSQRVLLTVQGLQAQAKSSEELFLVARLRGSVAAASGDTAKACGILKAAKASLAQSEVKKANDRIKNVYSCPPQ
jgi:serine/threonine-protein kinase